MSRAFATNTVHLYSSDHTNNTISKTIYNQLRQLSSDNNNTCNLDNHFSDYSGSIVLKSAAPDNEPKALLATLANVRSYDLLHKINNGYYLPPAIYKYPQWLNESKCQQESSVEQLNNFSGDLQEILNNTYLDFEDKIVLSNLLDTELNFSNLNDFVIDPENYLGNFKDCNLTSFLNLNKNNIVTLNLPEDKNMYPNYQYLWYAMHNPIKFYRCSNDNDNDLLPDNWKQEYDIEDIEITASGEVLLTASGEAVPPIP